MASWLKRKLAEARAKREARRKNRPAESAPGRDAAGPGNRRDTVWKGTMGDARRNHPGGGPL